MYHISAHSYTKKYLIPSTSGEMCDLLLRILLLEIQYSPIGLIMISLEGEALQTSKMSDTAVPSLIVNGLLSPAPFVFFVVILLGPVHSSDAGN